MSDERLSRPSEPEASATGQSKSVADASGSDGFGAPSDRRLADLERQRGLAPGGGGEQAGLAPRPADQLHAQGQALGRPAGGEADHGQAGVAPGGVERRVAGGGGVGGRPR